MIMADALIIGTVKEFIKSITAFCNCPTVTSYPKRMNLLLMFSFKKI